MKQELRPTGYISESLHPDDVRSRMSSHLAYYDSPAILELQNVLNRGDTPVTRPELIDITTDTLQSYAQASANRQRRSVAGEVLAAFPDAYTDEPLASPRKYRRAHDLDGSYAGILLHTRNAMVNDSATELQDTLLDESLVIRIDAGIPEESIEETVEEAASMCRADLDAAMAYIHRAIPVSAGRLLSSRLLKYVGVDKPPLRLESDSGSAPANVNRAIGTVADLTAEIVYGTELIPSMVVEKFAPQVDRNVRDQLLEQFKDIAALEAGSVLPEALAAAYAEAVRSKSVAHTADLSAQEDDTLSVYAPSIEASQENELGTEEKEVVIGEVPSPFPWLTGAPITLMTAKEGGEQLLFCTAMSRANQSISEMLRKDERTARIFDAKWAQVRSIQLTNPKGTHEYVTKVKNVSNEDYEDLVLLPYGNTSPNAKRIYFAKTTAERYPEINEAANAHGLSENPVLLILVAETDKANQLKTFATFGIKRVHARNGKAGSI